MEMHNLEEVLEIKNSSFIDLYPENLQNSKLIPFITEHLSFKISDFSKIYNKQEEESFNLIKKFNFLSVIGDLVEYNEEEINNIFICDESLLDENILKEIRYLKDVKYERFYRKNNNKKWVFVPLKESKQIFINFIKTKNIKMFNLKKSSIVNTIIYNNESFGLKDKRKNSDFSNNSNKWRKFSKNYLPHKGSTNSNYNNNYYYKGKKGRKRFNSDENSFMKNDNNNDYYYNNQNNLNKKKEKIEVEIGEIKYPLAVNYKYSINDLKDIYQKLKQENYFEIKPIFLVEENEILNDQPKNLQMFQNISTSSNLNKKAQAFNKNNSEDNSAEKIKIPKFNPLSRMKKPFNKFDPIPNNDEILVK